MTNWILCDNEMPENDTFVLVTIIGSDVIFYGEEISFTPYVTIGTYVEEDGWYGADGYPLMVAPTAWMPLPEPYRKDNQ